MEHATLENAGNTSEPGYRLTRVASRLWGILLDVLYPPRCGGCDLRGTLFCDGCLLQIKQPLTSRSIALIDVFASAGFMKGPLREAIHKLKYQSDTPLAKPLAHLLSDVLSNDDPWSILDGNPPVIMPVPLHARKEHVRGFNQSVLIARELSSTTRWPIQDGLVRVRETPSQVGLKSEDRWSNLEGAFEWRGGEIIAPVLLIDDVCTTGATLSGCADALRSAGAQWVYALTVARAVDRD